MCKSVLILTVMLLLVGVINGLAASVPINNSSFEQDVPGEGWLSGPEGTWVGSIISGWTVTNGGTFRPASPIYPNGVPDGQNVAYINSGTMSQVLSEIIKEGYTYTLEAHVGKRSDFMFSGYSVQLFAGGNLLASDENSLRPGDGQFLVSTVSYTAITGDKNVGLPIEIRIGGYTQANFDMVKLEASPHLIEALTIGSKKPDLTYTTVPLSIGKTYTIEVIGTYVYGGYGYGGDPDLIRADAGYTTSDGWASVRTDHGIHPTTAIPNVGFVCPGVASLVGDLGQGVQIIDWGSYRSDHVYKYQFIAQKERIGFVIGDFWSNWCGSWCQNQSCMYDNNGYLTVNIYSNEDLDSGLVAHYQFNGNANDVSGNNNNGIINGATLIQDVYGNSNTAYSFDGVDDYITVPDSSSQQILSNQLTVAGWIKLDTNILNSQMRIVNKQENNNKAWGLEIFGDGYGRDDVTVTGNKVTFHDSNGYDWFNCTANNFNINPQTYYHVAATDSNGEIKIYINGNLAQTCTNGYGIPTTISSSIDIGKVSGIQDFFFKGTIDDVRIYNRVLAEPELQEIYKETQNAYDGLVAYYPFDGNANDASGKGHNGLEYDGVSYVSGVAGQAGSFNGIGAYIQIPQAIDLNFGIDDSYTISLFAKIDSTNLEKPFGVSIIEKWVSGFEPYPFAIRILDPNNPIVKDYNIIDNPNLQGDLTVGIFEKYLEPITPPYQVIGDYVGSRQITAADNNWHHIVFVKEARQSIKLFMDGQIIDTDININAINILNNHDIYIGKRGGSENTYFKGLIDELRIYNRALADSEVQDILNKNVYQIRGAITSNGLPLQGVNVNLTVDAIKSAITDSYGAFAFTALTNGSYTVTPSLSGYTFNPESINVSISGSSVSGLDFASMVSPPPNNPPQITSFEADEKSNCTPLLVKFRCEALDPDGPNENLRYSMDYGDGKTDNDKIQGTFEHPYSAKGEYTFTCTVTDGVALTAKSFTKQIFEDTDGDSIPDVWEQDGCGGTQGKRIIDLRGMGASVGTADIFVEIDWQEDNGHPHRPKKDAIDMIVDSFRKQNINLHVDYGQHVSAGECMSNGWACGGNKIDDQYFIGGVPQNSADDLVQLGYFYKEGDQTLYSLVEFNNIKNSNFSEHRDKIFHYCVFGHFLADTGRSGITIDKDFIVTLGKWPDGKLSVGGTADNQAGTFMHELGHSLGLGVGDVPADRYNPNYLSVMNYFFQMGGLVSVDNPDHGRFSYSWTQLPPLNEGDLNEKNGINGGQYNPEIIDYGTRYALVDTKKQNKCYKTVTILPKAINSKINWDMDSSRVEEHVVSDIAPDSKTIALDPLKEVCYPITPDLLEVLISRNDWNLLNFSNGGIGLGVAHEDIPSKADYSKSITADEDKMITHVWPPDELRVSVKGSMTHLQWKPHSELIRGGTLKNYNIYRSSAGGDFMLIGSTRGYAFNDKDIRVGERYVYGITAVDSWGNECEMSESQIVSFPVK